jgi:uncharacterized protein YdaU (DUF1376 family)
MARTQVDHYIPFFGRDFYASTAMWTAEEVGHYIRLLVIQWDSGGLPSELERLELVSPGVSRVWPLLSLKFPAGDDGLRRNLRMEEHRERATELKDARSEAGQEGNRKRWGDRKRIANASQKDRKAIANGIAKPSPPSPSPSPSPTPPPKEELHTHTGADDFRQPGWAADEWQRFAAVWNATERAEPWPHLTAPDGWADRAATPGWIQQASEALARLPSRQYFDRPLPVTRFFDFIDRIRAGEFADPKVQHQARSRVRQSAGGNL